MKDFDVEARAEGDWQVLRVRGEIDVYTAPALERAITEQLDLESPRIVMDLAEVSFVDSTGLLAMIGGVRKARERNGSLVLVRPSTRLQHVLRITDLESILPVFDTVEAALKPVDQQRA
ncbi:MAG: STAS domain-containing protein [Actinomycetota bacterium]